MRSALSGQRRASILPSLHLSPSNQRGFSKFVLSWNNRKIRTAGNKSPLQLFILGMQEIAEESGIVASEYFQSLIQVNAIMHMIDTVPQALKPHW